MSIQRIELRKLLFLLGAKPNIVKLEIRADLRKERDKKNKVDDESSGGDFYVCFWSDVKPFAEGKLDLIEQTKNRIAASKARERLYPRYLKNFLKWWNEKKRWTNFKIKLDVKKLRNHFNPTGLGGVVKVNNFLSLRIGKDTTRHIYPYFKETPPLDAQTARIGLWLISKSFPKEDPHNFRILDVLRGKEFSLNAYPLQGNEEKLFHQGYKAILDEREKLRKEYF